MKPFRIILTIFASILLAGTVAAAVLPAFPGILKTQRKETLMAVGDLGFIGELGNRIIRNPSYPWLNVQDTLDKAHVLVGNLEIPLSNRGQIYTKKIWNLRANPQTVSALKIGGFDIVTLANNHMMDFGPQALQDTMNILQSNNILFTGAGQNLEEARKPAIFTTPYGVKIAFLSYSLTFPESFWADTAKPGTAHGNIAYFIPDIQKAKKIADLVVVSFHWSSELLTNAKTYQEIYARKCIDAGASLVIGHHPHVLQGLEVYQGGLIAYSLGNFVFGTYSKKVKDSIILAVNFNKEGLHEAQIYPVNINNYEVNFQPAHRLGKDAKRVITDLGELSKKYGTEIQIKGDVGVIYFPTSNESSK